MLHLITGMPKAGKSKMVTDLMVRVARGDTWPDGTPGNAPEKVLWIAREEVREQIIKRLIAHGMDDRSNIEVMDFRNSITLPEDFGPLERKIQATSARVVVFDPWGAMIGPSVKHQFIDSEIRQQVFIPLASLAERLDVTILIIEHPNKGESTNAMVRSAGSIGKMGAVRFAYLVEMRPGEKKTDPEPVAVFACVGSNNVKEPHSLSFKIKSVRVGNDEVGIVEWVEDSRNWLPSELLTGSTGGRRGNRQRTEIYLQLALDKAGRDGISVEELEAAADADGYSREALKRARMSLNAAGTPVEGFGNRHSQGGYRWRWKNWDF